MSNLSEQIKQHFRAVDPALRTQRMREWLAAVKGEPLLADHREIELAGQQIETCENMIVQSRWDAFNDSAKSVQAIQHKVVFELDRKLRSQTAKANASQPSVSTEAMHDEIVRLGRIVSLDTENHDVTGVVLRWIKGRRSEKTVRTVLQKHGIVKKR